MKSIPLNKVTQGIGPFWTNACDNMIILFHSYSELPPRTIWNWKPIPTSSLCIKLTILKDSAGSDWFDLPKTVNTNEFKRDWQILRMRGVLDPKHQKKTLRAEVPKYSQVGEIVAGPTDYFSGRLTRRERRQNLVEEAMRDYNDEKFKAKYGAIQEQKMSGKKNFYKKLMAQRRKRG